MNAVLVAIVMVQSLAQGQLPALPPVGPAPASLEPATTAELPRPQMPQDKGLIPAVQQSMTRPPALVPVNPDVRPSPAPATAPLPPSPQQGTSPLPLKLVDRPRSDETGTTTRPALPPPPEVVVPPGCVATPRLTLQRIGPASAKAGQPFSYELIVANPGTEPAKEGRLEEILPAGTRYVGGQPPAMCQGERLVWELQNIAPKAERRFLVEVETAEGGAWKSEAQLTVAVHSGLQTQIAAAPAQLLTVSGPSAVPVGHPVSLLVRVANTTAAPMNNLVVGLRMSPGLQHLQGDAIECSLDLAPGKTRELTVEAIATQTGRQTLDATVIADQQAVAHAQTAVTVTEQAGVNLQLLAPPMALFGTEQDFKVEIVNRGAKEQRELVITERLPEGFEFVAAEKGSYDRAARTIRWELGTLPPGSSRQFVFRASLCGMGPQLNRLSARAGTEPEALALSIVTVSQ